jgi:hypothetical protein
MLLDGLTLIDDANGWANATDLSSNPGGGNWADIYTQAERLQYWGDTGTGTKYIAASGQSDEAINFWWASNGFYNDRIVVDVAVDNGQPNNEHKAQLWLRIDESSSPQYNPNGYVVIFYRDSFGNDMCELYWSGYTTDPSYWSYINGVNATSDVGDQLAFGMDEFQHYEVYVNGTVVMDGYDYSITAPGAPGLGIMDYYVGLDNVYYGEPTTGPVNVNRSIGFTAPATTTTTRRKGFSRANAQTATGSTALTRRKGISRSRTFTVPATTPFARTTGTIVPVNVNRSINFTVPATTTMVRQKGSPRAWAQTVAGSTAFARAKGSPRAWSLAPATSTDFQYRKGSTRSINLLPQGTTPFSRTLPGTNVSRFWAFTTPATTSTTRSKGSPRVFTGGLPSGQTDWSAQVGVARATGASGQGTTGTTRRVGVLRAQSQEASVSTAYARRINRTVQTLVQGGSITVLSRQVGIYRASVASGAGSTYFTARIAKGAITGETYGGYVVVGPTGGAFEAETAGGDIRVPAGGVVQW